MNTKPAKVFNISVIQQSVRDRKQKLLFLHAITGCGNITSALYRQGKKRAFWLLMSNDDLPGYEVKVFNSETLSFAEVSATGKQFVLALYEGQRLATLDEYRYYAHNRNIASKSIGATFTLAALPPTSSVARQHSLRTYWQVQQLLGRDLPPAEWGWKYHNNSLITIATDLPATPPKLMKLILKL